MKCIPFVILACCFWAADGYPYRYYGKRDALTYGSKNGGPALSRYYTPHTNPRIQSQNYQASRYYQPDRRRQATIEEAYVPQQNDAYYPQATEELLTPRPTEIAEPFPTERVEIPTTVKAVLPELVEPVVEVVEEPKQTKEIALEPKKNLAKKKQVRRQDDEEDEDEEEEYAPKMPKGAFFPMFFGWGGSRSSGGASNGATAIANAFSTGRKGVATSHATAYGPPGPEFKSH